MKHTRLWIWLFAASAALKVLLYAQMIINNQKPPEAPIVKGTYARQEGGTLYRLAMQDDGYYCLYLAGEILELGALCAGRRESAYAHSGEPGGASRMFGFPDRRDAV